MNTRGVSFLLRVVVFAGALTALLVGHSSIAQTYDAASDFSSTNNPNGVWEYGWASSRHSIFNLYAMSGQDGLVDYWSRDANHILSIFHNGTANSVSQSTWTLPAGKLAAFPGLKGENSVVRWVAPTIGVCQISGAFTGIDYFYPTSTDVAVLYNTTSLFNGNISSYNVPLPFSLTQAVGTGETLNFTVGFGTDGNDTGDATQVDATIQLSAGIPITGLTFTPNPIKGGKKVKAVVTLAYVAPAGGVPVSLTTDNPAAKIPATVTVPAGKMSVKFKFKAAKVKTVQTADITATSGGNSLTTALTINPP